VKEEGAVENDPLTWHYGLVARWWSEFNEPDPAELAFYRSIVERDGQPALDLGCGTGRLLLPLLRAGLDVDGADISADMLAHCRERAEREGLVARLYRQAGHALDLPRTYRTIYMCGVFGIGGTRAQDFEALRRCHAHLAAGGTLVFSHEPPYANAGQWSSWLPEERRKLPQAWPATGARRRAADGDELELRYRQVDLDPLEQRLTIQMRALLWRANRIVADEEHTLQESLYFRNELLMLLAQAGFGEVAVFGGYADRAATADDTTLLFVARKDG
jgi:SAM-dependent methyltransferase